MTSHIDRLQKIRAGIVRQREIVTINSESLEATHASGFINTAEFEKYAAQKADTLRSLDSQLCKLNTLIGNRQ